MTVLVILLVVALFSGGTKKSTPAECPKRECAQCGAPARVEYVYCVRCGRRIEPRRARSSRRHKRMWDCKSLPTPQARQTGRETMGSRVQLPNQNVILTGWTGRNRIEKGKA